METVSHRIPSPQYEGRRVTPAQFLDLPPDEHRYELIEGVLHLSPSPRDNHARPHVRLIADIEIFLRARPGLGEVFAEFSVFLPDDNVLEPDIVFVSAERSEIVSGHIHGVPDLVIEILSPSTRDRDLGIKSEIYRTNGVREMWVVDPAAKSVELRKNAGEAWETQTGERLESRVLPGFVVERAQVFSR